MKRFLIPWMVGLLCVGGVALGQDPATVAAAAARQEAEENYKILKGRVEELIDANAAQAKRLQQMGRDIADLREQVSRPAPPNNNVSRDELKRVVETLEKNIEAINKKHDADMERINGELEKIAKLLAAPPPQPKTEPPKTETKLETPATTRSDEIGFDYWIKSGDSYSRIAKAYRERGVNITSEQIEKANPTINPKKMIVGTKIIIPAPAGTNTPAGSAKDDKK